MRERFDLSLEMPAVTVEELTTKKRPEASASVRARVVAARARQMARQGCVNARLDGRARERHCRLVDRGTATLLASALTRFRWSARAAARVLKVARTIADLKGEADISRAHLAEALQFRPEEPRP